MSRIGTSGINIHTEVEGCFRESSVSWPKLLLSELIFPAPPFITETLSSCSTPPHWVTRGVETRRDWRCLSCPSSCLSFSSCVCGQTWSCPGPTVRHSPDGPSVPAGGSEGGPGRTCQITWTRWQNWAAGWCEVQARQRTRLWSLL